MKSLLFSVVLCCISLSLAAQVSKTINVTAGGVSPALTAQEKNSVTNLTVIGTINASDFKTLRDDLPMLEVLDISGAKIAAYTGTGGTGGGRNISYPADEIPVAAFYSSSGSKLTTVVLHSQTSAIGVNAFNACSELTSITFPSKLTAIGNGAFNGCYKLSNIIFPIQLKTIGDYAFNHCHQIAEDIIIPASVTSIGKSSFKSCYALKSLEIKGAITTIPDSCFASCSNMVSAILSNTITLIGNASFYYCDELSLINLPFALQTIGNSAFGDCISLQEISFPSSLTSIGDRSFYNCESMEIDGFPSSMSKIGNYAFFGCWKLATELSIPSSVNSLGVGVFRECINLKIMHLPDNMTAIPDSLFFSCDNLETVNIPNNITSIGNYSFFYCPSLTGDIEFPTSLVSIGDGSFEATSSLNRIYFPAGLQQIGETCFLGSSAFFEVSEENSSFSSSDGSLFDKGKTRIIKYSGSRNGPYSLPATVTSISAGAFYSCTGLTEIVLPDGLVEIGDWAFVDCSGLKSILIPNQVTTIMAHAFYNCYRLAEVVLPPNLIDIGIRAFSSCPNLSKLFYFTDSPVLFDPETEVFIGSTDCSLFVKKGWSSYFNMQNVWSDFNQIIEAESDFVISSTFVTLSDLGENDEKVLVVSEGTWIASESAPWLTITPNTPINGNAAIVLSAEPNNGEAREATVLVFSSEGSDTIYVTQLASSEIYFSTQEVHLQKEANSTATINVSTLGNWLASSDQAWLTVSPNSLFTGNGSLTVTATQNTGDERKAYVTVISSIGTVDTITVIQQAGNVFSDNLEAEKLEIYPNPFSDRIILSGLNGAADIKLYDLSGRLWVSTSLGKSDHFISTGDLPYGFFILKIISGGRTQERLIIKE